MTVHPLAPARAEQEASDLNSQLGQVVYNAIVHVLKAKGRAHADDLEPFFPAEHVDRCRKLIGGQFGSLAGRKYIEGVEYVKSTVPARKGGKSWVYVFTKLGQAKLVGISAADASEPGPVSGQARDGHRASGTCTDSGEKPTGGAGVPKAQAEGGTTPRPSASIASPAPSPEPLQLFAESSFVTDRRAA